ncbi:MAG: VWA-like domain-containing protein [Gammaproteobacteria bacterium]|nr:VWA-like domain-containing protein [Gammaproteobacteria bacterium]
MSDDIEIKLAAARTRLILDKPFLGALVLRLPMIKADPEWCKTTATDARSFYYNEAYIKALSLEETQFVLAHEALHCGLSHFARRQHRVKPRWDVACDYAINPLLLNDGLKAPPGALHLPDYEGMTAEEIYPYIDENTEDGPMDQHLYDDTSNEGSNSGESSGNPKQQDNPPPQGNNPPPPNGSPPPSPGEQDGDGKRQQPQPHNGASKPEPLNQSEMESLSVQWQQRLAGAAQQAMQAGKMGPSMARLVDHLLQPQLPWRMLLARYMNSVARDDYSFSRPSSRREGDAILPSLHSAQTDVTVVLDTSGSIKNDEMQEFLAEVDALKGQLNARVTLHACDDKLSSTGPWVYEPWETMTLPESLEGGGGTRFTPAFQWAEDMDQQPNIMLYFTDAEGEFPEKEPPFPVIWLVKGKSKVPWGQRIQLN